MIAKFLLFPAMVSVALAAGPVQTVTDVEGNTLRLNSAFSEPPRDGLFPVVVEMSSPRKAARWSVNQGMSIHGAEFRRSMVFECPAGESRRTVVLLASNGRGNSYFDGVHLEISGAGARDTSRFEVQNRGGMLEGLLVGETAVADLGNRISGTGAVQFATGMAPTDWRAYEGYPGVVVADKEWRAMDPGARVAIGQYVRGGGRLVILVPDESSAASLPAFPKPDDPKLADRSGLGLATVAVPGGVNTEFLAKILGRIGDERDTRKLDQDLGQWRGNAPEFFPRRSSTVTSFLMLLVLVAFAVLIGPVNLFVIAPSKRRHRLFFSVPVIALSTSLVLMIFVLLGDGIGGKGHRFLLIENRPGEGEAVNHVIQYQTSRCGVLFTTGFESDAAATILDLGDRSNDPRELIAEPDKLEGSGPWFVSRSSQNYRVAAVVPGRGRVEIRGQGADARLTSTFAYPLDALWFQDQDGKWWQSGPLKMGEPAGVQAVAERPDADIARLLRQAPPEIIHRANQAARRRGCFIAFTTAPEGVKTHGSIRWDDQGVVTGPLVLP